MPSASTVRLLSPLGPLLCHAAAAAGAALHLWQKKMVCLANVLALLNIICTCSYTLSRYSYTKPLRHPSTFTITPTFTI
ncbi:hypothetical protein O3P69_013279 [Scylla paramamosain]|uniref:Secreted protein n=1 Tax=Scylla paramamosain TaxID=85552 RepID=A0AAW0TZE4_SCYPA